MNDIFEPKTEPTKTLYNAFKKEAENRYKNSNWMHKEIEAVFMAAVEYVEINGGTIPTLEEIEKAEISARGHSDYGSKWAIKVAAIIIKEY